MLPFDKRAQVLANCKCLYGPDIDVVTSSHNSGLYQAVAVKFDPSTASWTRLVHSTGEATSSGLAISALLRETEIKIAEQFTTNGWSVPLAGETMTLHRVQSPSTANNCGQSHNSSLEFITTPDSKSQSDAILDEEAIHIKSTTVPANVKIESAVCERPQEGTLVVEETPYHQCAVVDVNTPVEDDGWKPFSTKKDKKKKKGFSTVEEFEVPLEPEPTPVDDDGWGYSGTKKDKKKKKGFSTVEEPEAPLKPEPTPVDDDGWGYSGTKKDKKKKKKGFVVVDEPEAPFEPTSAPEEDDGWRRFGTFREDKNRESKVMFEKSVVQDTPLPDPEPKPASVGNDDGVETSGKDRKKNGQSNVEDVLRLEVTTDELFIKTSQAPPVIGAVKPSTTTASLSQTVLADITSQSPVGKTVVLKIVHTSKAGTQTLQTMVNLADNTEKAIVDAVNQYLDFSSDVQYFSSCRSIDIKFGSGKNGDLDLSALEENRWLEYLEYLSQYTRFPELTVHASDGQN